MDAPPSIIFHPTHITQDRTFSELHFVKPFFDKPGPLLHPDTRSYPLFSVLPGHKTMAATPLLRIDDLSERAFWPNRCETCCWRHQAPAENAHEPETLSSFCRVCNGQPATCANCSTTFPPGYYRYPEAVTTLTCTHAELLTTEDLTPQELADAARPPTASLEQHDSALLDQRGYKDVAAALRDYHDSSHGRVPTDADNLCRPCFLRAPRDAVTDPPVRPVTPRPPERYQEIVAGTASCVWCKCRGYVGTEITFTAAADDGVGVQNFEQTGCTLCKDGEEVLTPAFWETAFEGRDELIHEFEHVPRAATALADVNREIALLRYQYRPNQARPRRRQGAGVGNNVAQGAPQRRQRGRQSVDGQYMGRRADSQESGLDSYLHSFGTGLWCPQYLRKSLGIEVHITRRQGGPLPTTARKRQMLRALELLEEVHPVYSDDSFQMYVEDSGVVQGLGLTLGPGGICGVTLRTHAAHMGRDDEVFIPRDAAADLDRSNSAYQKHAYLTKLWRKLIAVEFPLLFPGGVNIPDHVSWESFLRQYHAQAHHPIFAEMNQELLVKNELNRRQLDILAHQTGTRIANNGVPSRRLPARIPGSFAQVAKARGRAFSIVRKHGACDLFLTITLANEWLELLREAERRNWDFDVYDEPAATARAYRAKMDEFVKMLEPIYGEIKVGTELFRKPL